MDESHFGERLARVEERMNSADRALEVTAHSLDLYKASSNEWRQALNDQRTLYVTRTEVIAIVSLMFVVMGTVIGVIFAILKAKGG